MYYEDMFSIVEKLPFDTEAEVFSSDTERIYLLRPSVLPRKFSSYNPETNILSKASRNLYFRSGCSRILNFKSISMRR